MNDAELCSDPALDAAGNRCQTTVTQSPSPAPPQPHEESLAMSPEQEAFLLHRFSATLEDPLTGRRIR